MPVSLASVYRGGDVVHRCRASLFRIRFDGGQSVWSKHGGAPSDYQEHGHTARQAQTHRYVHYDDIISHAHTRTHKHTHVL